MLEDVKFARAGTTLGQTRPVCVGYGFREGGGMDVIGNESEQYTHVPLDNIVSWTQIQATGNVVEDLRNAFNNTDNNYIAIVVSGSARVYMRDLFEKCDPMGPDFVRLTFRGKRDHDKKDQVTIRKTVIQDIYVKGDTMKEPVETAEAETDGGGGDGGDGR